MLWIMIIHIAIKEPNILDRRFNIINGIRAIRVVMINHSFVCCATSGPEKNSRFPIYIGNNRKGVARKKNIIAPVRLNPFDS